MPWKQLLNSKQLNYNSIFTSKNNFDESLFRNNFQKDSDKIVFCSAFRRLADKTQVDGLSKNDYIRTRLTHSLEVAAVGRSIGNAVQYKIVPMYPDENIKNLGDIVYAASLAHDIGNPPFGHMGEDIMCKWFKKHINNLNLSQEVINDYSNFDGNAQGFRIISQLQDFAFQGGLRLTYSTLATFVKYPYPYSSSNKFKYQDKTLGIFSAEMPIFEEIAQQTNMKLLSLSNETNILQKIWARHPLNFLMEAADDICYSIIDVEDAFKQEKIAFKDAERLLLPLVKDYNISKFDDNTKIIYLRSKAIDQLVNSVVNEFINNIALILLGQYNHKLCQKIPEAKIIEFIQKFSQAKIYSVHTSNEKYVDKESILNSIMDIYLDALLYPTKYHDLYNKIVAFSSFEIKDHNDLIRTIFDYVSGMTDSFAEREYIKLCQ